MKFSELEVGKEYFGDNCVRKVLFVYTNGVVTELVKWLDREQVSKSQHHWDRNDSRISSQIEDWVEYVPPKPKKKYVFIWVKPGENNKKYSAVGFMQNENYPKEGNELYREVLEFDPRKVMK